MGENKAILIQDSTTNQLNANCNTTQEKIDSESAFKKRIYQIQVCWEKYGLGTWKFVKLVPAFCDKFGLIAKNNWIYCMYAADVLDISEASADKTEAYMRKSH